MTQFASMCYKFIQNYLKSIHKGQSDGPDGWKDGIYKNYVPPLFGVHEKNQAFYSKLGSESGYVIL
jgi:hypothetical protein